MHSMFFLWLNYQPLHDSYDPQPIFCRVASIAPGQPIVWLLHFHEVFIKNICEVFVKYQQNDNKVQEIANPVHDFGDKLYTGK